MKHLLLASSLFLTSLVHAADWKVIAESASCEEKIQILGKEGEKYVLAVKGPDKLKLYSKDGSVFSEQSLRTTEFESKNLEATYRFIQPAYVEANPPKLDVTYDGEQKRCKMNLR